MIRVAQAMLVIVAWLSLAGPIQAKKASLPPELLERSSQLIVQGKTTAHVVNDDEFAGGGKRKLVVLKVLIDGVRKGDSLVKPGDTIEVQCWRGTRRPWNADMYDDFSGNHFIPDTGVVATFYLEKNVDNQWAAIWPNGIDAPAGSPGLSFPSEPPARSPWMTPMVLAGVSIVVLVFGIGVWRFRRGRASAL